MNYLQPFLHELVTTLAAPTQVLSAADGGLAATEQEPTAQGILHADVRAVSRLRLRVGGRAPEHIATRHHEGATTFVSLVRGLAGDRTTTPDPQLRLDRRREVTPGTVRETLLFSSARPEPVELTVELTLGCDGAPMAALRSGTAWPPVAVDYLIGDSTASWSIGPLQVRLVAEKATVVPADRGLALRWSVQVPAAGEVSVSWELRLQDEAAVVVPAGGAPLAVPELVAALLGPATDQAEPRLRPWLTRSLADLNGLRMATADSPDDAFFAAGSPWYLTLFGRDSLWTARLLLPVDVAHAGSTLRTLARRQGTRHDPDSAEAPGKIPHELRREQFAFGDLSLPSLYYGTIDATLLWVCLLHDAWRAGLPEEQVRDLMPACQAALGWMTDSGAGPDGFLAYVDTSGHGLSNQGWKDSADAIRFADGTVATGPVALVEVQGYAHEAAHSGADLLDAFGLPGAERYREWAAQLAGRFRSAFWCGTGAERFPALALDGQQQRVDSLTSNIGHLLGTGILTPEEELLVTGCLASPELDSGLGLRTMSAADRGYWPLSYHCGSVWPHDTAIVIASMVRAGLAEHAAGLIEGLLRASHEFDGRLPELWSGEGTAVPYPAACRPQAWSAAAAITVASALVGARRTSC